MQNGQGLPPRAGSEYDDLHAHGADRYAPTDLRAFAARVDLITASEYEDALRACANMDDLRTCIAMMDLFRLRVPAASTPHEHDASTLKAVWRAITPDYTVAARQGAFQELGQPTTVAVAAAESEMGVAQAAAPPGGDEFTFEQLGDLKAEMRADTFEKLGEMRADTSEQLGDLNAEMDTVAAAEPGTGVREMDMTVAAKIFAVAHQDHYISKSIAADAPTGSTLNKPESRAFTTNPRLDASRAKVKVGPLARIQIDDEVYT